MVTKGWIELTQLDDEQDHRPQIVCVRIPVKEPVALVAQCVVEFANGKFQAIAEFRKEVAKQIADLT